jgi:murein DD-endopeptidase MepM/ murein hydrolase activator NlpD
MSAQMPPLLQDSGVPFDLFIQALTEQLDKAQASMAIKARVGRMPLTFAVKDVSIDLRAFVQMVDDEVFVRPAGPGETEASTVKLALTTITKAMVEENAVDFKAEDPKFSLKEALGDQISDEEQRRLERIGVRTITQLNELKATAGTDVIARLSRMPVNRLQQALMSAAAPRVTRVDRDAKGERVHVTAPRLRAGRLPFVRAAGSAVPVIAAADGEIVLAPLATQLGCEAEVDFGDGEFARVQLAEGQLGRWEVAS